MPDGVVPTPADLAAVTCFVPLFEQPGYWFGAWELRPGAAPLCQYAREVREFIRLLYERNIEVIDFAWAAWQSEAARCVAEPQRLATADLLTVRRLITTHLRSERFSEGYLLVLFQSGHMTAVLRRLAELATS
jgi:hypothetical protein